MRGYGLVDAGWNPEPLVTTSNSLKVLITDASGHWPLALPVAPTSSATQCQHEAHTAQEGEAF